MPQTLKSSGENTNQLKYIKTLQFWWLKTPIILLGKLFEHSGDICWDLCYNETIEFFESNLIWILRWQWHCIILWECFWISLMPKFFHLFTAKNNSSLHWQCICIIFGDNVLGSLYCQKFIDIFDANIFPSLHYQKQFEFSDDNVFRFQRYHCICIISGDKTLPSLHCQKTLISLMTMHFGLLDANAFKSLHWQHLYHSLIPMFVQRVRFFL